MKTDWEPRPVVRLDLSTVKTRDVSQLPALFDTVLRRNEERFGMDPSTLTPGGRLVDLIRYARAQAGRRAVILVDEYDAPLLNVVHDPEALERFRDVMREFYTPKACDVFLMGWITVTTSVAATALVGAALMGIGHFALNITWGWRLSTHDEAIIEFSIPASLALTRLAFFIITPFEPIISRALVLALPIASAALAQRDLAINGGGGRPPVQSATSSCRHSHIRITGSLITIVAIHFIFRCGYSSFRALANGPIAQGRFFYLSTFVLPIVVFIVFIYAALNMSSVLDVPHALSWCMPLLLLVLALAFIDTTGNMELVKTANTVYSMCVQAFFWILMTKGARQTSLEQPRSGLFFSACYLVGFCGGMVGGYTAGTWGVEHMGTAKLIDLMPMVICVMFSLLIVLKGKATGFARDVHATPQNGNFSDHAAQKTENSPDRTKAPNDFLESVFCEQAHRMAEAYKLSAREEEIVTYLLAGRNRPYVRDTLRISLNTVNTHVKKCFSKTRYPFSTGIARYRPRRIPH